MVNRDIEETKMYNAVAADVLSTIGDKVVPRLSALKDCTYEEAATFRQLVIKAFCDRVQGDPSKDKTVVLRQNPHLSGFIDTFEGTDISGHSVLMAWGNLLMATFNLNGMHSLSLMMNLK